MRNAHALAVLAALAALPACDYTSFRQSSLVPVSTIPPPISVRRRVDVYAGDSLVTVLGPRSLRTRDDAGLWLPRHQIDGAITLRVNRFFGVRVMSGVGLAQDATVAAPTTMPRPDAAVPWLGPGVFVTYLDPSGFGVSAELDTTFAAVPSVMQRRDCPWDPDAGPWGGPSCGPWSDHYDRTDIVPMFAFTLRGVWAPVEWLTLYAAATVRTHPSNDAAFSDELGSDSSSVGMGVPAIAVGAGAELTIEDAFSVIPHLTWTVWGGPVDYGPTIGLALRGRFGDAPWDE